jgi:hypothetical protein
LKNPKLHWKPVFAIGPRFQRSQACLPKRDANVGILLGVESDDGPGSR